MAEGRETSQEEKKVVLFFSFFFLFSFLEAGAHYVAQADLELTVAQARPCCLDLPRAGITGMHHHTQQD
jgi:hypothetical protein